MTRSLLLAPLAAIGLSITACPGTLEDPGRFTSGVGGPGGGEGGGGCPDIPTAVFQPICATAACHNAMDKAQGLDLQSPGVATRLVGVCSIGGGPLIDPAAPDQSVLYQKLSLVPPFGSRMPLGKMPLDDATTACVLAWIKVQQGPASSCDAGLPPDASAPDATTEGGVAPPGDGGGG